MKIQCSCGAKYELDVVPGMGRVTFVCQNCGQDYSEYVNSLISQQMGAQAAPPQAPATQAAPPPPAAPATPPPPVDASGPRLKINRGHAEAAPQQPAAEASKYCSKHRTELATEQCQVCHKPICPQCLDQFGPFCSPFCRNKVEGPSMTTPSYGGRKFAVQREFWRKTGLISTIAAVIVFGALGFWFWYAWIGSVPRVYFSVRWDDISHSGGSWIADGNQIVFLHGGTLARYNLKTKQKVWSVDLVTPEQIKAVLKAEDEEAQQQLREGATEVSGSTLEPANLRQKHARIGLEEGLSLHGAGKNIWVASGNSMTHYDWDTGNVLQTINVANGIGDLKEHDKEFLAVSTSEDGSPSVTHINMDDGSMNVEKFSSSGPANVAKNTGRADEQGGGLPLSPVDDGKPLNPQKVQNQVQNMSYAGRLALPALLGNAQHNRQINSEIAEEDRGNRPPPRRVQAAPTVGGRGVPGEQDTNQLDFTFILDGDSYLAFAAKMIQENMVEHEAVKAPPKKSALSDPNLGTANETAAVNEQLNDIQRTTGGDKVTEDLSTYQVAVRRPNSTEPDWTGTLIGPPQLFPLQTVNIITAGKTVIALDKSNKKIWQSQLTYDVVPHEPEFGSAQSEFGAGPCVEHDGTLYIFDQAVLTAFDPATGNVKWRIPSVGIVGMFFDDKGNIYLNTTSGSPDDIKYSRQIDVTKENEAIVQKIDGSSGKILWSYYPGGYISYLSGKYIFAYRSSDAGDDDEQLMDGAAGLQNPSFMKIIRINPSNGHEMWDHEEPRAPMSIQFDNNTISLVFKKEVEVLRFFSL
ncbi:MAG TPA: PQQ-binding-like beta-propeller repeat protein [Pseudomonadales bacterium]|nr:PQQ-binding-like beta-propeller repeat protein [Pseudomonadales bacterium]